MKDKILQEHLETLTRGYELALEDLVKAFENTEIKINFSKPTKESLMTLIKEFVFAKSHAYRLFKMNRENEAKKE